MNQSGWDVQWAARGASDSRVLVILTKMLEMQSKNMGETLADFGEQLKGGEGLDDNTFDRAYWHAGYVAAMRDVLQTITCVRHRVASRRSWNFSCARPYRKRLSAGLRYLGFTASLGRIGALGFRARID
jgi:hypothetical protein